MKHSPLPWSAETYSKQDCIHEIMMDANGKAIFDTANSDNMLIETEHDEDGFTAWDAQGRADFEFILTAIKERDEFRSENADNDASFDLRHAADMRAIKRWRKANPGSKLVCPDHADMVVWLLSVVDRMRKALEQYARFDYYHFLLDPIGQKTDPTKAAREALQPLQAEQPRPESSSDSGTTGE